MTDLLGTCRSWGDGWCVVEPEHGEPVRIAISDIVSGKPVPPRPSVRRRVSAREAELHTHTLWATVEAVPLGEWLLRSDRVAVDRLRRRANSCLAMGDPGLPLPEAAATVQDYYRQQGREPRVQVEADSLENAALLDLRWVPDPTGDVEYRLASLAQVRRRLRRDAPTVELAVSGPRVVATTGGVARGEAALDGDWVGVHGIEVDAAHRGRGLGGVILGGLLEWAAEQGAATVWLHVETRNTAAQRWYDNVGLATHHLCRYLTAPAHRHSDPTPAAALASTPCSTASTPRPGSPSPT